jgi:hypothetical protein
MEKARSCLKGRTGDGCSISRFVLGDGRKRQIKRKKKTIEGRNTGRSKRSNRLSRVGGPFDSLRSLRARLEPTGEILSEAKDLFHQKSLGAHYGNSLGQIHDQGAGSNPAGK